MSNPAWWHPRSWWKPLSIPQMAAGAIAVIAIVLLGYANGGQASTIESQQSQIVSLEGDVTTLEDNIHRTRERLDDALERVEDLEGEADDLAAWEAELAAQQEDLDAQQADIDGQQQDIADSQITGGVHVVGQTVDAGTYSTAGPSGSNGDICYYAFLSGTGSDSSILENNIVEGPATVTLVDGDVFESSGCSAWQPVS